MNGGHKIFVSLLKARRFARLRLFVPMSETSLSSLKAFKSSIRELTKPYANIKTLLLNQAFYLKGADSQAPMKSVSHLEIYYSLMKLSNTEKTKS